VGNNPQGWVTTSPAGINHWLYDVFVKGIFPESVLKFFRSLGYTGPLVDYIKGSTKENEKNLDEMYYQTLTGLYAEDSNLAAQELEGEFITLEGKVWTEFSAKEDGTGNVTTDADYTPGVPVEWWVDDGFTKKHPRVILFAQVVPPNINVFAEYIAKMELPETTIANALALSTAHDWAKPNVVYIDSSAAELKSRLWSQDIDTIGATHDIEDGIKHASAWIKSGDGKRHLRLHPRCNYSIAELPSYVRQETSMKPIKDNDHCSDAMRYGLYFKDLQEIILDGAIASGLVVDKRQTRAELQKLPPSNPAELLEWNFGNQWGVSV
jgi:phage terminase large subunit